MEVNEFESRILGDKIDLSMRHKDAVGKAILYRVVEMPFRDTLVRLANEVRPDGEGTPCYLQVGDEKAMDIGYTDATIQSVTLCLSILQYSNPVAYWVEDGVVSGVVTTEELLGTVKFKKGGDIGEYI